MEQIFTESQKTKEMVKAEREKNKMTPEQRKQYNKQYYASKNEIWKMKYNPKDKDVYTDCNLCKCTIKKRHVADHAKTKKHQKNLENMETKII